MLAFYLFVLTTSRGLRNSFELIKHEIGQKVSNSGVYLYDCPYDVVDRLKYRYELVVYGSVGKHRSLDLLGTGFSTL